MRKKQFTIYLTEKLLERLKKHTQQKMQEDIRVRINTVVTAAIEQYLEKNADAI